MSVTLKKYLNTDVKPASWAILTWAQIVGSKRNRQATYNKNNIKISPAHFVSNPRLMQMFLLCKFQSKRALRVDATLISEIT